MSRLQPIYDIAEICAKQGIIQAILCPGSRCAPLTLAFTRHENITARTFNDERSAAFVALGIAQQTHQPTVLVCTSGSAAYNFAPAVAEAFFQEVPMLIFTADRPKEWIDQLDGQTIKQSLIFGSHVKKSFDLTADYEHSDSTWYINRVVNEAVNLCREFPKGPVHVNVPLREPLYPSKEEKITFSKNSRIILQNEKQFALSTEDIKSFSTALNKFTKTIIVAGQNEYDESLIKAVEHFSASHQAVVVGDVISNFHSLSSAIRFADSFLAYSKASIKESLRPELLITFGKSVISKNLKLFLRKYKPTAHWHIQSAGAVPDTFQALTRIIPTIPQLFFESLGTTEKLTGFSAQKKENFTTLWQAEEHRVEIAHQAYFKNPTFNELDVLKSVISALPARCNLHLSNSMSVRYANMIGLTANQKGIQVYSNRGTSGIDGCTSTAVGNAISSDVPTILITGDMAFFYDRNAFWHNYKMPNLHIVVINNQGGIIFGMIDGPSGLPESQEYFVTQQKLTAKNLADEFAIEYTLLDTQKKIKNSLKDFFELADKTKILEIKSDQKIAKQAFDTFNSQIKKAYDS
jgi:2-succinyl-5-enolpyruvyl-6-hydroxy-3-cyclohexene-1-carboxylate synthase